LLVGGKQQGRTKVIWSRQSTTKRTSVQVRHFPAVHFRPSFPVLHFQATPGWLRDDDDDDARHHNCV